MNEEVKKESKWTKFKNGFKKALPWICCGVTAVGSAVIVYEIDKAKVRSIAKDIEESWYKEKEIAYDKGGHDEIIKMMDYCKQHGKSIVGTYSTKGFGEENAELWLIAEVTTEKPDMEDILEDNPYTIYVKGNKEN